MVQANTPDTTVCRPLSEALAKLGDKWTILIAIELEAGPKRFSALQRSIDGISQRMLALTLRGLERDGLVERTVYPTKPPSVEYALTNLGKEMAVPVRTLCTWVTENLIRIEQARHKIAAAGLKASKTGVTFSPKKPIPDDLIETLALASRKELAV